MDLKSFEMENGDVDFEKKLEFVKNLPEIGPEETFCFDCNPGVPCFNRCCAELTLPLTPYDVMRLCRNQALSGTDFEAMYVDSHVFPDTGFPMPTLRMSREPGEPCPFVSPAGCMVYEDRPSACRAYPLGRGTKVGLGGVAERFFIVREDHCHGFDAGAVRTPAEWFEGQGLAPYNRSNDRYMRLMAMVRATGKPLDDRLAGMARLSLFHLDQFRLMIAKMRIFSHVEISEERKTLVLEDSLEGDTACLDFALDWMELVIFGKAEGLKRS